MKSWTFDSALGAETSWSKLKLDTLEVEAMIIGVPSQERESKEGVKRGSQACWRTERLRAEDGRCNKKDEKGGGLFVISKKKKDVSHGAEAPTLI